MDQRGLAGSEPNHPSPATGEINAPKDQGVVAVNLRSWAILSLFCVAVSQSPVSAQEHNEQTIAAPAAAPDTPPTSESSLAPEQQEDLNNWLAIIRNPNVAMDQRVFSAKKLLAQSWPEAQQAIVSLLNPAESPGTRIAVGRAIVTNGPAQPALVEPLLTMLEDADPQVRDIAGQALAKYGTKEIIGRLMELAQNPETPVAIQTAAINALGYFEDGRQAVEKLMSLLGQSAPSVEPTVYKALSRASGADLGQDTQAWTQWWESCRNLSNEEWLKRVLQAHRQRLQNKNDELADREARLLRALEENYLLSTNGQRTAKLKEFLDSPLEQVRLLSLRLIQDNIAEGTVPNDELAEAIRRHLADSSTQVQANVLSILGHLRNADDAPMIVEMLQQHQPPDVRLAAINTLGKLSNPVANDALLSILTESDNAYNEADIAAAARSLGRINSSGISSAETIEAVASALASKYQTDTRPQMRVALLLAMADVADARFEPLLMEGIKHPQAEVRLKCVEGLTAIGDPTALTEILGLLSDANTGVRRKAAESIGQLGNSEAHLQALLSRLAPETEVEAAVRSVLWTSFENIWGKQNTAIQLTWVRKLDSFADRQLNLLQNLETRLGVSEPQPPELIEVHRLLATRLESLGRFADAARYRDTIEKVLYAAGSPDAAAATYDHFRARLRTGVFPDALALAKKLLDTSREQYQKNIQDELVVYLGELQQGDNRQAISQLIGQIDTVLPKLVDQDFNTRLEPFRALASETPSQPPAESTAEPAPAPSPETPNS